MPAEIRCKANVPQGRFLAMPQKFRAFVAGYGSGKTWVGSMAQCQHFYQWPKVKQGYFAPTYAQIRDIFYPTIEEVAYTMGLNVEIREGNKEVHFYSGKQYRGTTICRSMDKPGSIVGFKIGNALVDELDLLKTEKATEVWRKILGRMRYKIDGLKNGIDVTTTPEGFKFTHAQFVKAVSNKPELGNSYGIIQASTRDNEKNLPDDYIQSLCDSYPLELIDAYIDGQFTNLNSGTVYKAYDKNLNDTDFEIEKGEVAHVGMDFNVGNMAAIIHVERDGKPYAVDEIMKGFDTPDMIVKLKERLWDYVDGEYKKTRKICIYPDASGKNRKSVGASQSDTSLLEHAGFSVIMNPSNPPVKDRVNAMNKAFCNASGERFYHVNKRKCTEYSDCLEQQPYKNGEPSKDDNQDHAPDAGGYYIAYKWPIHKPVISTPIRWAM